MILLYQRRYEAAIAAGRRAVSLARGNALNIASLADTLRYAGRFEDAIALTRRALRLDPQYPAWFPYTIGISQSFLRHHREAIDTFESVLARNPTYSWVHANIAYNYMKLGESEKARRYVGEELKVSPGISLARARQIVPCKDSTLARHCFDTIRRAGLPE